MCEAVGSVEEACGGLVTVVIPARDEAEGVGRTVRAVMRQRAPGVVIEVVVVDDGSGDGTAVASRTAGARVLELQGSPGNPGAARNRGAAVSRGDPIIFLDADCEPGDGWLQALLRPHASGAAVVGGAIEAAPGQGLAARCDNYCAWYHVHAGRKAGRVPNHPPANLSVRRAAFLRTAGFAERFPVADGHEELGWQAELGRAGEAIVFEPAALVRHHSRGGWGGLFRRNYRWAYSAMRCKAQTGAARWPWLYRRPILLMFAAPALVLAHTLYTTVCWARAGVLEPLAMLPAVLAARVAYMAGFVVGGMRWMLQPDGACRPMGGRWR